MKRSSFRLPEKDQSLSIRYGPTRVGQGLSAYSLLAFTCLVILAGCDRDPKWTGLLFEGTVVDGVTGAPIAGASLSVGDGSGFGLPVTADATTDSEGRYTLSYNRCMTNPYLSAYATGYYWGSKQVGCEAERQTADFVLTPDPTAPNP